jgi:hypothetical protein
MWSSGLLAERRSGPGLPCAAISSGRWWRWVGGSFWAARFDIFALQNVDYDRGRDFTDPGAVASPAIWSQGFPRGDGTRGVPWRSPGLSLPGLSSGLIAYEPRWSPGDLSKLDAFST